MKLRLSITSLCQRIALPCSARGLADPALSVIVLYGHFNDPIKLIVRVLLPLLASVHCLQTKIISGSKKCSPLILFSFFSERERERTYVSFKSWLWSNKKPKLF